VVSVVLFGGGCLGMLHELGAEMGIGGHDRMNRPRMIGPTGARWDDFGPAGEGLDLGPDGGSRFRRWLVRRRSP
jgi:hypothetical protein